MRIEISNETKARLQALGWAFLTGAIIAAYDAVQSGALQIRHVIGTAAIGGLAGAALYLKQRPREVWSEERREAVRAVAAAKADVVAAKQHEDGSPCP